MVRRPTPWPAWPASAAGPATSARCTTTSSAWCSPTTCGPTAWCSGRPRPTDGPPTGRCLIVVTPDAERTMNTYLGASSRLRPRRRRRGPGRRRPDHLPRGLSVRSPRGQGGLPAGLRHRPRGRPQGGAHAVRHVLRRAAPRRVADPGRSSAVDVLFANEAEIQALYGVQLARGRRAGPGRGRDQPA